MSPFDWFKKEKPLLSLQSMGGGAAGPLMGGASPNVDASGGTISEIGSKTIHQFTSSGSFVVNSYNDPFTLEMVIIGGGGGGGSFNGPVRGAGGGGAGGVAVDFFTYDIAAGTFPVTIGAGGLGGVHTGTPNGNPERRGQQGGTTSVGFPGPKCPDIYGPQTPDWGALGGGYGAAGGPGGSGGEGGSGGGGGSGGDGYNTPFFGPNGIWIPNSAGTTPTVSSNGKRGFWVAGPGSSPVPANDMTRGYFGSRGGNSSYAGAAGGGGGAGRASTNQNGGLGFLLPTTFQGGNFGAPGNILPGGNPSPGNYVGGGGGGCGPPAGTGQAGGGGAGNNGTGNAGTAGTGGGGGGGLPAGGPGGSGQVLIAYSTKGD
tara:strand:- start:96 stop:1208 length:1113 start_codon:yes stop_codon:yes gene_type:complete